MATRLVYAERAELVDGIRSYSEHCRQALERAMGVEVSLEYWRRAEPWLEADLGGDDILLVQYNPFSYGRWGVAPWLVRRARRVRRRSRSRRLVVVVHEAHVPSRSVRWALMGRWQRWQLAALGRYADAIVISTEAWRAPIAKLVPNRPVFHIPVGSNLPDERNARSTLRESRGWTDETLVIATLGSDEASRLADYVSMALNELAATRSDVVLANLGVTPLQLSDLNPRIIERRTGYASPTALAAELAAADVFLAPYEDGVSARRTTFVAALQHGLALIGTDGRNTDGYLRAESGVCFDLVTEPDEFVRASVEIGTNEVLRGDYQRGARALFERRFEWSTIADSYLAALSQL